MRWPAFFAAAAAFNLAVGAALLLAPGWLLAHSGMIVPAEFAPYRLLGWFVVTFGLGYAIVASAPARHGGIVRLGVIGKLGVFAIVLAHWYSGVVPTPLLLLATGDLLWALAFLSFLRRPEVR